MSFLCIYYRHESIVIHVCFEYVLASSSLENSIELVQQSNDDPKMNGLWNYANQINLVLVPVLNGNVKEI